MWITLIFHSFQESFCTSTSGRYSSSTTSLDCIGIPKISKKLSPSASSYILRSSSTIDSNSDYFSSNKSKIPCPRTSLSNIIGKNGDKRFFGRKFSHRHKTKSSSEISSSTFGSPSSSAEPSASSEASLPGYTVSISPASSPSPSLSLPESLPTQKHYSTVSTLTVPPKSPTKSGHHHHQRRRHHSRHHHHRSNLQSCTASSETNLSATVSTHTELMGHQQLEHRPDEAGHIMEPTTSDTRCKSAATKSTTSRSPSPMSGTPSPSGSASLPADDQSGGSSCSSSGVELEFNRKCTISADSLLLHPDIRAAGSSYEDDDDDDDDEDEDEDDEDEDEEEEIDDEEVETEVRQDKVKVTSSSSSENIVPSDTMVRPSSSSHGKGITISSISSSKKDSEATQILPKSSCLEAQKCIKSVTGYSKGGGLLNPVDSSDESSLVKRKISGSLSSDQIHKHMMYLDQVTLTTGTRSASPKMMIFSRKFRGDKSGTTSSTGATGSSSSGGGGLKGCLTGSGSFDQASTSKENVRLGPDNNNPPSSEKRRSGVATSVLYGTGRIARLLRRTHSAGCSKDVPSHALFLREKPMKSHPPSSPTSVTSETIEKKRGRKLEARLGLEDMKQRLRFLRRRHTDSSLQSGNIRPTPGEAQKWSDSFEILMKNKYGASLFKAFLAREFSQENIEFWIACEEFKKTRSGKKSSHARKIYDDFVAFQSPREINIDGQLRNTILQNLNNPEESTFDVAQRKIQGMLEQDAYLRFLQSDLYRDLLSSDAKSNPTSFPMKFPETSSSGKMSPESSL